MSTTTTTSGRGDRTWLVAVAASLWGISSLWRGPLAKEYPSLTIVFWEHLVLTVLTLWWLVPAVPRVVRASTRTKVSVPCASYQDGLQQVAAVKTRRRQRGYQLMGEVVSDDAQHQ